MFELDECDAVEADEHYNEMIGAILAYEDHLAAVGRTSLPEDL